MAVILSRMSDDVPGARKVVGVPRCRKCQRRDLRPIADPRTNRLYRNLKGYLAICYRCGAVSTIEESDVQLLLWPPHRENSEHPSTACLQCGYDVRGMSIDENCPECGSAILTARVVSSRLLWRQTSSYLWITSAIAIIAVIPFMFLTTIMIPGAWGLVLSSYWVAMGLNSYLNGQFLDDELPDWMHKRQKQHRIVGFAMMVIGGIVAVVSTLALLGFF